MAQQPTAIRDGWLNLRFQRSGITIILADCNSSMTVVSSLRDQSPMRSEEIGRVRFFKHTDCLFNVFFQVLSGSTRKKSVWYFFIYKFF